MKRVLSAILFLLLFLTSLLSGIADASPSLIGDTVSWKIESPDIPACFFEVYPTSASGSAVVRNENENEEEVEIRGYAETKSPKQEWTISTDIDARSFTVSFTETLGSNRGNYEGACGRELLSISLSDLDWVDTPGAVITRVLWEYTGDWTGSQLREVSVGADFIELSFKGLLHGDTYVFSIEAAQQPTPVPPSILLFGSGLAGIAAIRKKFDKQS